MRSRLPLDFDAGFLVAGFGAVYAAAVGAVRGLVADRVSGLGLGILVVVFGVAGMTVGSVIAGRPDFGPTKRAALVRGFVATIPLYAAGGLLFLPPERWFAVLPILSVAASALVGPPIGIFMYRLHRRLDSADLSADPGVQLAWLKGELLGSWTPLLLSIALLALLGVGMRAFPAGDVMPGRSDAGQSAAQVADRLPVLYRAVRSDSTDSSARYQLGTALTSVGRFEEAMDELALAISLDSIDTEYWRALGRAAFFGKHPSRSVEAYWNALRLEPGVLGLSGLDRVILDAVLTQTLRNTLGDQPLEGDERGRKGTKGDGRR